MIDEPCTCIVTKHGGHTHTQLCTPCRTKLFNQVVREDFARREARVQPKRKSAPTEETYDDLV